MKLKILFFPAILICSVVFVIWYIWPMYQEGIDLRDKFNEKQQQLSVLEERKKLVDVLSTRLQQNKNDRNFFFQYIPKEPDEEHVISAIVHAAAASGVNLTAVDMLRSDSKAQFFSTTNSAIDMPENAEKTTEFDSKIVERHIKRPVLKEYMADIIVIGSYENTRRFLDAIHRIDRLHGTVSADLSLYVPEESSSVIQDATVENNEGSVSADNLILTQMLVAFAYAKDVVIPRGARGTIFEKDLDISFMQSVQAEHIIAPPLGTLHAGRTNPFINN